MDLGVHNTMCTVQCTYCKQREEEKRRTGLKPKEREEEARKDERSSSNEHRDE